MTEHTSFLFLRRNNFLAIHNLTSSVNGLTIHLCLRRLKSFPVQLQDVRSATIVGSFQPPGVRASTGDIASTGLGLGQRMGERRRRALFVKGDEGDPRTTLHAILKQVPSTSAEWVRGAVTGTPGVPLRTSFKLALGYIGGFSLHVLRRRIAPSSRSVPGPMKSGFRRVRDVSSRGARLGHGSTVRTDHHENNTLPWVRSHGQLGAKVRNVSRLGSQLLGPRECYFPTPAFPVDSATHAPLIIVHRATFTQHLTWTRRRV